MIKVNKIAVCVLLVIISLIVGYALFNESITLNGTATASGNFQLEFYDMQQSDCKNCEDLDITTQGNNLTVSVKLLNPGSNALILGKLKNTGTVDARFSSVSSNKEFNADACKDLGMCPPNSDTLKAYRDEKTGIIMFVVMRDENGNINSTDTVLTADDSTSNTAQVAVYIIWDPGWDTPITEAQEVSFTTTFNFEQAN